MQRHQRCRSTLIAREALLIAKEALLIAREASLLQPDSDSSMLLFTR